ncbi:Ferredoxin-thioredoxin reductase, variable chain [Apostasia shenzhenica]|uniref:Ferredoxin-thioredoxin reductase, variable chain n=1 Tax=Apostasia shenzhenica TaxID=1088818 RepID=A0A2I0A399_9ASPA|nr:Ferredoxin-thioredoxin reductase, variable chain [Apostasia shenzhenica]
MPATSIATAASLLTASLFRQPDAPLSSIAARPARLSWPTTAVPGSLACQVALTADLSSSWPEAMAEAVAESEAEAAGKIGARIRVKAPIKVYHVMRAPDLNLYGMEGEIKQYVGAWKGKRISSNLPFKVEFLLSVEGQEKPVKFAAHLKEDEFEYLS